MWSFTWRNHNGDRVYTCKPFKAFALPSGDEELIVSTEYMRAFGVFKATSVSGEGTTTVASPSPGGSILIGDIAVSAKKQTGSTLLIEFDDGANTEIIMAPDTTFSAANYAWTPAGRVQSWRDADLKIVTTGAQADVTVTITYVKLKNSLKFGDWNLQR